MHCVQFDLRQSDFLACVVRCPQNIPDFGARANVDRSRAAVKPVIAVLDDDSAVRHSLKFLLEIEGFDVRSYALPSELLNDDDRPPFHCLIVDFHMPEMNGLDLVIKLRERKNDRMRAILVTSHPNESIRERAAALGIPIVLKPFRELELIERIREAGP